MRPGIKPVHFPPNRYACRSAAASFAPRIQPVQILQLHEVWNWIQAWPSRSCRETLAGPSGVSRFPREVVAQEAIMVCVFLEAHFAASKHELFWTKFFSALWFGAGARRNNADSIPKECGDASASGRHKIDSSRPQSHRFFRMSPAESRGRSLSVRQEDLFGELRPAEPRPRRQCASGHGPWSDLQLRRLRRPTACGLGG
ncbi:hypothetical protein TraAM80_06750 [Trypanosoma rangeli]|uniref:Uncharacterized protein n=1 Tax=Trypanosoma rangeli TaxID=5698 RepID=A0A422N909_TRYRA|nr:uncharacterized protein TraAM80_06750 [Trypanosoma rangeli]RNF01945.1 hypothetical protein TraAM80_06750 [Trypanosoma rangeli]|eukprot:RNF01945.1 hypothetical protein TraAM80_06750 [Trypanosoma rangeli]